MNITPIKTIKARFMELAKTRDEFEALELVSREFHLSHERAARLMADQKSETPCSSN